MENRAGSNPANPLGTWQSGLLHAGFVPRTALSLIKGQGRAAGTKMYLAELLIDRAVAVSLRWKQSLRT